MLHHKKGRNCLKRGWGGGRGSAFYFMLECSRYALYEARLFHHSLRIITRALTPFTSSNEANTRQTTQPQEGTDGHVRLGCHWG